MLTEIKKLPKIELHCHMDGSMGYEVTRKLAAEIGEVHSLEEIKKLTTASMECKDLGEYLAKFDIPLKCIKTAEGLKQISYDFIRQAHEDNIKYTEMRFAPGSSLGSGLSYRDIFEATSEGLKLGKQDFGVESGMIVCAMRHIPMEDSLVMLKAAKECEALGIVGCDIAGDEKNRTNSEYSEYFNTAKKYEIPFTIHSGECGNALNIKEAIELGARRVGHGIAMADTPEIIKMCAEGHIGVEMCPTSNLQTKAVSGMDEYPFMKFLDAGIHINISTDNRTVSGTTCSQEFELLDRKYDLNEDIYYRIYRDSVEMSFADDEIKDRLLKYIK